MDVKFTLARLTLRPRRLWWRLWSKAYRWLFQRAYRDVPLPSDVPLPRAAASMAGLTWRKDGLRELFDAVGYPGWVQHCLDALERGMPQPAGALDCDDFAVWCATVVSPEHAPLLLSVQYRRRDGSLGGHMVCMCRTTVPAQGLLHAGNWGLCGPFLTFQDLVDDVTRRARSQLVGWYLLRPDLSRVASGTTRRSMTTYDALRRKELTSGR